MRLVARHGADLRFSASHGWLVWDGQRWQRDLTQAVVRCAKETVRAMYREAAAQEDREARRAQILWALQSESAARLQAMVKLAESEPGIPVTAADLDRDRWLLNCGTGTLELRTGQLRPPCRADLITKLAPVPYDPAAPCPTFERFLGEIMAGRPELVAYLQRAVGYSLTGDVSEQCLFFLHGLGANGKSTLLDLLLALLGDYAMPAPPGLLLERGGEHHPTERADLAGKRLVVSVEVGEGKRLAEELLKQLTGGDRLKARFMRQDFFEFAPAFKLWLAANHKPLIRGTDHAIWRRIPLIPFDVTFTDDPAAGAPQKDPELLASLKQELPGILAWAVRGCQAWQAERLNPPPLVRQATAAYRAEMDTLGDFLADCCTVEPQARAKAGDLYAAYKAWGEAAGERVISQKAFGTRLQERGFVPRRDGYTRWWLGLGLLAPPPVFSPGP
jgi:putative DNA primase/helicase